MSCAMVYSAFCTRNWRFGVAVDINVPFRIALPIRHPPERSSRIQKPATYGARKDMGKFAPRLQIFFLLKHEDVIGTNALVYPADQVHVQHSLCDVTSRIAACG
jgi:hypothetical protein